MIVELTCFSASDLIKKSAAQIKFERDKNIVPTISEQMKKGVKYQEQQATKFTDSYQEMRGVYKDYDDCLTIFFTNDIITPKFIAEVKMVDYKREVPFWYLENSLLQAAFYKSLLMKSNGSLQTPKFRLQQGQPLQTLTVDTSIPYRLIFGKTTYNIIVKDPEKIIHFYSIKALSTTCTYEDARTFDRENHHKEFEKLSKTFTTSVV